jgi:hypothetical protein
MSVVAPVVDRRDCQGAQHGTSNAYRNHGCRCDDARRANSTYQKLQRAGVLPPGRVSTVGVVRRRRALAAMGWGLVDLAPRLGVASEFHVNNYLRRDRVLRSTYEKWVRVYDELSMTWGPNDQAREMAHRKGWPPPLAWDDDEIDDPAAKPARMPRVWKQGPDEKRIAAALAGDDAARAALESPDRRAIVVRLHSAGLTDSQIVARSGIKRSTIRAIRTQLCLSSNHEPDVRRRRAS